MLTQRSFDRERANERGSIVVAVMGMMFLVLIGTAAVMRGQAELRAVGVEADDLAAQAAAEQGVAETLARLSAGDSGDFSASGTAGDGTYQYKASAISTTEYLVRSEGTVDGRVYALEVTIGGERPEPYSLFVGTSAFISNQGTITGRVATNGQLSVRGTVLGDAVDLYGPRASCNDCPPGNVLADALDVPPPTVPTGTTQRCPSDGDFTGVVDGRSGVPFVCTSGDVRGSNVRFIGTVTVANPPLIVYVRAGLDIDIRNASVNADGEPDDFQLYGEGDDDYWWFDVWNSRVQGVLYGPGRDSFLESASIVGSVSMGVLYINSPRDVWINPAASGVGSEASGWVVTSWERVPSS